MVSRRSKVVLPFALPSAFALAACHSGAATARHATGPDTRPMFVDDTSGIAGLHVVANQLAVGVRRVRLLGASHSGTEYACVGGYGIFDGPSDASLPRAMASWNMNTVRIPLNEDCWLGINGVSPRFGGAAYRQAIADFVAMLRNNGMWVIVDLHWSAPGNTLARQQQPMADADHAPDFWRSVAATFKNDSGVLFDLFNEPYLSPANAKSDDPWHCWLRGCSMYPSAQLPAAWQSAGMQQLVDAVRGAGASNVILVGGLAWSNDLRGWLAHRPEDPLRQLVASFHLYNFNACRDAQCWDSEVGSVAQVVPVVTGEVGEDDCEHGFLDRYVTWADSRAVSYLGWAWNPWDCKRGPALVTNYDGAPTPFGDGLRAHLKLLPRSAAAPRPLAGDP